MPEFELKTPVAFIIFNRPDTTEKVFREIARARPPKLLVVGDGPRTNREGEAEKVEAARAIIKRVDWPCEVLTNYSDANLGCKVRVSSGLDWVFEQVPEAIILEDDCLPEPSFFRFCQEMLERYRHDQRVGMISGDNFQFGRKHGQESYYFSKYVHIWGWACWRDRWQDSYDVNISRWPVLVHQGRVVDLVGGSTEVGYWSGIFERVYEGRIDTWDYQWGFANWAEGRVCIIPSVNLISNIGFGVNATHTVGASVFANLLVQEMRFPLLHPVGVIRNLKADAYTYQKCYGAPLWRRVLGRARALIHLNLQKSF